MARKSVAALTALGMAGLTGCAGPPPALPPAAAPAQHAASCHVGPDGRRPDGKRATTDRGLGGTGAMAERGIGGTGRMADRGLGGTGIVGIITGFASMCVNGVEVGFDEAAPVLVDGARQTADALRAGQVAAIAAEPVADGLRARSVAVRHEVTGPVESVAADGVVVAGQRVRTDQAVPALGTWVAVSGLRDPDGTIHASRIDPAAPGVVTVSGPLTRSGGTGRIGALRLHGGGALPDAGTPVTVSGALRGQVLAVRRIAVDPVLPERADLGRFLLETYARREGDTLLLGPGLRVGLGPGFDVPAAEQATVLVLEVGPQGGLVATSAELGGGGGGGDGSAGAAGSGQGTGGGHGEGGGQSGHGGGGGEGSGGGHGSGGGESGGGGGNSGSGNGGGGNSGGNGGSGNDGGGNGGGGNGGGNGGGGNDGGGGNGGGNGGSGH